VNCGTAGYGCVEMKNGLEITNFQINPMAHILNDTDLRKLIGTVIIGGDEGCIKSNSYVVRLGADGEFLSVGKEFSLGKKKKGIKIQPGHSVAVTSFETLDFRRETVRLIYPNCDLYAFLSPTTDLSREGIVAPATNVDPGFHGTLNWTLTNTSSEERKFVFMETIFRLLILKLSEGEVPQNVYAGDYQSKIGYVRSQRKGAPVGMKDSDWEDAFIEGGPEEMLENLMRSGYPWNILGERLQVIDRRFAIITDEYGGILDSISNLQADITSIKHSRENVGEEVRKVLQDEATALQNQWLVTLLSSLVGLAGFGFLISSSPNAVTFVKDNAAIIGICLLVLPAVVYFLRSRQHKPKSTDSSS
jgi:deoxycytidine triphosphate deaminase